MKFYTESKYLKHEELPENQDLIVTIKEVKQETLERGNEKQKKFVVYFKELEKGLVLNKTNGTLISGLAKSQDTDDWISMRIALYVKDDIEMGGEIKSGIRVRSKRFGIHEPTVEEFDEDQDAGHGFLPPA